MFIHSFQLGPLGTNCYVLSEEGRAVAIDPGMDPSPVMAYLDRFSSKLETIFLTHLHWDHIHGCAELATQYGAEVLASPDDAFLVEEGEGRFPVPPFEWLPLEPGRRDLLGSPLMVLDTPGHTPGGLSLYLPKQGWVFTGDLLFRRNVGRTDLPGGDSTGLMRSIKERIFILPPEVEIYPGHGPMTTVAEEMANNPFFTGLE